MDAHTAPKIERSRTGGAASGPRSGAALLLAVLPALGVLSACRPDSGLQKVNSEPEAQITAPTAGASVLEGTTVTLRGAASDANHDASDLLTRWFAGDDEACPSTTPATDGTTTCDVQVPEGDMLSVRLEVVDPDGAAATADATYPITPNADPVPTIQSPVTDGVHYSDQLLTFRGTVSDAEDAPDALTAWWEDGDTRLDTVNTTPTSSGEVLGYATLTEGPHALELHVQDTAGNEGIATVLIDVGPPNSAPDCVITAPEDGGASELGARIDLEATVSDVDVPASNLTVSWASDKDGPLGTSAPDSSGAVSFRTSDLSADDHRITMTVTDDVGAVCVTGIDWTVATPPAIELESPVSGDVVNEGDTLTFTARVSDDEDVAGDLWVTWESSLDGLLYEGPPDSSGLAEFLDDTLSRGDHALTVSVTDTAGLYATARSTFTVNGLPTAPGITLTPASPDTDDDLRVTIASASVDPEGDAISYAYAWSREGVSSSASTSATLPASATTRGDTWSVSVTATDGLGTSPAGTASVTIENTAPSLSSLSLAPDPAYEDDVLTCSAGTTSDADGDTVGLTYEWYVDGVALGQDNDTLDGAFFDRGQDVYCTATPTDGTDDGVTRTSNTVTIGNSEPSVATVSIAPSSPTSASTLTCTYAGYDDADGDADQSTIAWSVDGVVVGTGVTLSGGFVGGDVVTCTVTPDDGTDTGSDVSASVTVANTAPVLGTVSISPATAYNDDLLTCSASATDADGGTPTLSYAWTNITRATTLGSGNTLSLTSGTASSADTITCTVSASDGSSDTASGSGSVTLGNRAPVATASLSPTTPTSRSTLSCTGSATDADADGTSLSFTWTVDGAPVTASSTSSTLSTLAGVFAAGQLVACTVTATDGKTGTDADSASVTIDNTAPVVSSATLSPGTVYTNDTLTASVTASDPDGDTLSYSYDWYVDGTLVTSGSSSTLSGATYFDRDEVVTVTVTADDGVDTASATSAGVTVSNTAPSTPLIQITPSDAASGDDLTCEIVTPSTDADGDAISYTFAWDVDGSSYTDATDAATSSFVDGTDVGGEETWTCEVVADDGSEESDTASSSVTTGPDCWSLSFDGIDDYLTTYDVVEAQPTTITVWIRPEDVVSWRSFFMNDGIAAHSLSADVRSNRFTWSLTDTGWDDLESTTPATVGTWTHLALQWDGSTARLYVDGALEDTASSGYPQTKSYTARFGMGVLGGVNRYLSGNLLDLQIYARALTAGEIAAIHATPFSTTTGLSAHYLSGTTTTADQSGNARHGTVSGTTWEAECPR